MLNKALSKKVVDSLKPEIERIAIELLSGVQDNIELMSGYAYPLPVLVISQMLGIPPEDRGKIKSWSDSLAMFLNVLIESLDGVVHESLRYESPVQRMGRFTVGEINLGDYVIPEGKRVLLLIGAANRDPEQFDDPNTFDFNRERNNHIAFGYGHHLCSGSYLAKVEMTVAISALLQKFNLEKAEVADYQWRKNLGLRGLEFCEIEGLCAV